MGMTADLVRGAVLTAIAYALALAARRLVHHGTGRWMRGSRAATVVAAAASVAGGAAWKLFHSTVGARWFFIGGLGGSDSSSCFSDDGCRDDAVDAAPELPFRTRLGDFRAAARHSGRVELRELLGNGIGFCIEPALRLLPGGIHTPAFHAALARESRYFNAHPYLASVAVGALARAELDGEDPVANRAFSHGAVRTAGQRRRPSGVGGLASILFARVAGGVRSGRESARRRRVVSARRTTSDTSRFASGGSTRDGRTDFASRRRSAIPCFGAVRSRSAGSRRWRPASRFRLALGRIIGPGRNLLGGVLVAVALGSFLIVRLQGRIEGWRLSLIVLAVLRPLLGDSLMPERAVQIVNKNGLHARPAAEIVKLAAKFQSEITIVKDDLDVNGKSIMGVMMLAAEHGSTILLRADGPDADAALDALATLVRNKFGER